MKMSKEAAEKFADAIKAYVEAIVTDMVADPTGSTRGFEERQARPKFIEAISGWRPLDVRSVKP